VSQHSTRPIIPIVIVYPNIVESTIKFTHERLPPLSRLPNPRKRGETKNSKRGEIGRGKSVKIIMEFTIFFIIRVIKWAYHKLYQKGGAVRNARCIWASTPQNRTYRDCIYQFFQYCSAVLKP
jgi:hypothetical protein